MKTAKQRADEIVAKSDHWLEADYVSDLTIDEQALAKLIEAAILEGEVAERHRCLQWARHVQHCNQNRFGAPEAQLVGDFIQSGRELEVK